MIKKQKVKADTKLNDVMFAPNFEVFQTGDCCPYRPDSYIYKPKSSAEQFLSQVIASKLSEEANLDFAIFPTKTTAEITATLRDKIIAQG